MTSRSGVSPDPICFVISSLGSGGAERVVTTLANYYAAQGRHVRVITLSGTEEDFYELSTDVYRVALGLLGNSANSRQRMLNNWRRIKALRQAILAGGELQLISFMDRTNVLVLLACMGTGRRVVVSERIDPRHHPMGSGWSWLRKCLYPRAWRVVVQTKAVAEWANEFLPSDKVRVIPNPVKVREASDEVPDISRPYVLSVGRLDRQKGFDVLIKAWANFRKMSSDAADWKLVILGEGPERKSLEELIVIEGLAGIVIMPGRQKDLAAWYNGAALYVLSSRFEGFPNTLLEAMAAGLPVIATDCPSGPNEIIVHLKTGWLVPPDNVDALVLAFERFFASPMQHSQVGLAAREAMEAYEIDHIARQWDDCF